MKRTFFANRYEQEKYNKKKWDKTEIEKEIKEQMDDYFNENVRMSLNVFKASVETKIEKLIVVI